MTELMTSGQISRNKKSAFLLRTRQVYNLFQDLWNRFPSLGGWGWVKVYWVPWLSKQIDRTDGGWVQSTLGAKVQETNRQTDRAGGTSGVAII